MSKDKDFEKIVLHVSREMHNRLLDASEKKKLSIGSIFREAINSYLNESEKKNAK
jgi:hypothetical protein